MFTGLIEEVGRVASINGAGRGKTVRVSSKSISPEVGESIAVNGVCLTVCKTKGNDFELYASSETLRETNLSKLTPGSKVNLERALRIGDRLGGHLVQGHIDGVATVSNKVDSKLSITPPEELMPYLVLKGSVAIDGVSLTVTGVRDSSFSVAIIPYTRDNTTLGNLRVGDRVNLEVDIMAKYLMK